MISSHDFLVALALKYDGDRNSIRRGALEHEDVYDYSPKVHALKVKAVTILDKEYPQALYKLPYSPLVLFYEGDLSLIQNPDACVSIVGSRKSHTYGEENSYELAAKLAQKGFSIVSGLAIGIDTKALEGALPYGKAVAVLGNGTRYYYPPDNEELQRTIAKNGLLISEYPPKAVPNQHQFPARNRIIAGLSSFTLIGEAEPNSGSLITAAFALLFNRDVGCLPHPIGYGEGCNRLIQDGAFLLQDVDDILAVLGTRANWCLPNAKK